jgi:TolB-like protein/DNA-binding winged helix-turn-helix (wHTH) protein/Flp pilus assembly protein TadD
MDERPRAVWQIGSWQVSPDLGEISRDGRCKKLDLRAMRLLMFLAERPGQVVAVGELLNGVWGKTVVTPHSVYEAIAALRQTLEDSSDKPEFIVTLPRRGYRLIAPVEISSPREHIRAPSAEPVDAAANGGATVAPRRRGVAFVLGGAAFAIVVIGTFAWVGRSAHVASERAHTDKSIAVLPFLDLSENKDQEYFADGLAEELLDVLANLPGLRVIGRTSSFQFKNKNEGVQSIGAKLGASYVVEGSVRRAGNHVRVAAQLIRAADGAHQWSKTYDRNVSDALQLEAQLAASLGRALELSVESGLASSPIETSSPEANDHYLRGLHALDTYTRAGTQEAADQFQAAIALDPQFTAAYVSLGKTHFVDAEFGFVPPEIGFPQVRENALKALKLNPQSAIARALLARVATLYTWDWKEAQRESDMALTLGPQNPFALAAAADLAAIGGHFERSERLLRASLVSDPLNPETHFMLADALLASGRLEEAEAEVRRCLAISPSYAFGHFELGYILSLQGREESVAECQREAPEGGQFMCLAGAYDRLGRTKEADAALEAAIREYAGSEAFWIASVFADRHQDTQAFEWLDRAYRQKEPDVEYIKATPDFNTLKSDPRYKAFIDRLHLPE